MSSGNSAKKRTRETTRFLFPVLFLWILLIHTTGLYFFATGFLLSRQVLESRSECSTPPIDITDRRDTDTDTLGTPDSGCWFPKKFKKAVILVIDALRYDFTVPYSILQVPPKWNAPQPFHDALTVLYETAIETPRNAFLLPFIADPPTTTLQRLKGLTTGTLPTFIEAGSNFAGSAIQEDNLVTQLRDAGKKLVHLGDDTWVKLFPHHFLPNLSHPYDSFHVKDLHSVDDGVTEHLLPLLRHGKKDEWDVIFGHFLGVDHVGHYHGPDCSAMRDKLRQMDRVIRDVIAEMDDDTLLVVMGDHGMDSRGNHGGETDNEIQAALWMYSHRGVFDQRGMPSSDVRQRWVPQIDLVPTLSLLLGVPIPFNNLGSPIEEALAGVPEDGWDPLIDANLLTAAQIERYYKEYTPGRGSDTGIPLELRRAWALIEADLHKWNLMNAAQRKTFHDMLRSYQRDTLSSFRNLWIRFHVPRMMTGVAVMLIGTITSSLALWRSTGLNFWEWLSALFTLSIAIGLASNSYVVWEDNVLLFFLTTFGICATFYTSRLGTRHLFSSISFLLGTRIVALSRVCREEQLPFCTTTIFTPAKSIPWAPIIPWLLIFLPQSFRKRLYPGISWQALGDDLWLSVFLPTGLVLNATFWTLEVAVGKGWMTCLSVDEETSKGVRICIAQMVLILAVLGGIIASFAPFPGGLGVCRAVRIMLTLSTAVLLICMLLSAGPMSMLSLCQLFHSLLSLHGMLPRGRSSCTAKPAIAALLGSFHFFTTGHNATLGSIRWETAYLALRHLRYPWSPLFVTINTFAAPIVAACTVPLLVLQEYNTDPAYRNTTAGRSLSHSQRGRILRDIAQALGVHGLVYAVWAVAAAVWAGILRRHLMVFAVFCPRFLMAAALLVIIDGLGFVLMSILSSSLD